MYNRSSAFIILLLLSCFSNTARADWPVGKKRLNLTPSFTYYSTSRIYDADGKIKLSDNNGKFLSKTFALYGVAGLSRRVDLIFNVPISFVTASDIYQKERKTGVGDVTVGFAYHTPSKDLKSFFTTKALLILPVYSNVTTPYLGYGSKGIQLAANYSFNPKKKTYIVMEGTYARYFNEKDGPNQYGLNLNYGIELPKSQIVSFSFNHLTSSSADKTFSSNLNINKDFMFGKISGAYGKKISRTITPFVQLFYTIYGRNSGQGLGGTMFVSIKLP